MSTAPCSPITSATACRLHLHEDWSFTELAEYLQCTRSGAHDLVRRALAQLEHFEERLGHAAEMEASRPRRGRAPRKHCEVSA